MITDFVRNGKAWFRCSECGEELELLKYELTGKHDFPVINIEKSTEHIEAFNTKHSLCKKTADQLIIEKKERYLEDSLLWYCLEWGVNEYKSLSIHQRINLKQSYIDDATLN